MPSLLENPWQQLIPLIPVADHAETVAAVRWQQLFDAHGLGHQFEAIFAGHEMIRLTRHRLLHFAYPNPQQKCLEILLWGYPSGMQGNNNVLFLQNVDAIAEAAAEAVEWPQYYNQLSAVPGLGISTITKLAYFHGRVFQGHIALILDRKIIDLLAAGRWEPLGEFAGLNGDNAAQHQPGYVDYLKRIGNISAQVGGSPDQIEFLLYSWGSVF